LATLVALIFCAGYGFADQHLFQQFIWTPLGLRRFLIFAGCYAGCFAAFSWWKPHLFPAVVLTMVLAFSIAAVGILPILTVGLILLASEVLGRLILTRGGPLENDSISTLLAMLAGLSVYMLVVSLAAHVPITYPAVYLAMLVAPLLWGRRAALACLAKAARFWMPARSLNRSGQFACGLLIFVLLLHWLVALEPETGPDALAMHLVIPWSMAVSHQWAFDVTRHLWAVMPMGADWCFTLAYVPGGEAAARLLNFSFFLCIVALLVASIRGWLPRAPAWFMAALFAATPLVQLVNGSLFAENLWALLCLGALVSWNRYDESGREMYLYLAWVLAGAGAATKFGALAMLPPLALISLWSWRKQREGPAAFNAHTAGLARICLLCFLAFFIFAAPPYLSAYAKTGNPVFPFLSRIFPSPAASLFGSWVAPPPQVTPRVFYDLTFSTTRFRDVQNGALGFQYFLLLPLGAWLMRRTWPRLGLASGLTLLLFAVVILLVNPGTRYLYPALVFATLFLAAAFAEMRVSDQWLYRAALALAGAVFCADLYFLPSSGWMFKDFVSNPASNRARAEKVTAGAPERDLVAYLNRVHPGLPVAFFESASIVGLRAPAVTKSWHNIDFYDRVVRAKSAAEYFRILTDYRIHLVIAQLPSGNALIPATTQDTFLKHCTEAETSSGSFYVGRLKDACTDHPDPFLSATLGEYDDVDPRIRYAGAWTGGNFPEASHGTVTYSNTLGAEAVFHFVGAEVVYVYTKAFNRGVAEIIVDGASHGPLDLYSPSVEWRSRSRIVCGAGGPHTLEIRVTGRKDPRASDAFVDLDALIVH